MYRVIQGDALTVLHGMADESVQCIITSPPYWGLRSYLGSDHLDKPVELGSEKLHDCWGYATGSRCGACYICRMTAVFSEARRVLRSDGTLFLNCGDTYATQGGNHHGRPDNQQGVGAKRVFDALAGDSGNRVPVVGLKPKDLCGIPERLALSLQADGWWWRSKIIWRKPAPMPGSQQDRPTVDFEPVWLFAKSARYFWDGEAVKEDVTGNAHPRGNGVNPKCTEPGIRTKQNTSFSAAVKEIVSSRTIRTVWDLPPMPTSDRICRACRRYFDHGRDLKQVDGKLICTCGASDWIAHYAGFPLELPERCLMAGTSERGCCPACGKPWARVVEKELIPQYETRHGGFHARGNNNGMKDHSKDWKPGSINTTTTGWKPQCSCGTWHCSNCSGTRRIDYPFMSDKSLLSSLQKGICPQCGNQIKHTPLEPVPCTVADIFHGSGTTGLAALKHGRDYVGIELSADYIELSRRRTERLYPLLLNKP